MLKNICLRNLLPVFIGNKLPNATPNKIQELKDGRNLHYILSTLRLLGLLPFHCTVSSDDGEYQYCWKWNSWAILYTFILDTTILAGILWTYYVERIQSKKASWYEEVFSTKSSVEKIAVKIFPSFSSVMVMVYIVTAVSNTKSILRLIEKWRNFEKKLGKTFPKPLSTFSNTYQRILSAGIFGGSGVIAVSIAIRNQLEKSYCSSGSVVFDDDYLQFCKIKSIIPILNIMYAFFEDIKNIFLLRMIADGFDQVKICIAEWCDIESRSVTFKDVREWKKLIFLVREQARMTANAIAVQNIINSFILLVFLCFSFFLTVLLIRGTLSDAFTYTTYAALCLTGLGLGRLTLKAKLAEMVVFREKSLTDFLRLLEVTDEADIIMARLELISLVSVMDKNPSKLELYKLLVINYSLLTRVFTTVVTYLVVLLQFNDL